MEPLSQLPPPPKGSREEVAAQIIDGVLDLMLNRHIHVLEEAGYLRAEKYHADYGWNGAAKKPALRLKHDLMDEAQQRFRSRVSEALKEPTRSGDDVGA